MTVFDRRHFLGMTAAGALTTGAAAQPGPAIDVVRAFGFLPDGRSDNYEAFHRFADHVNRTGGGSYRFPPGRYVVGHHRGRLARDGSPVRNSVIDRVTNLAIDGAGAQILLNGAFHRTARNGRDVGPFMPLEIHRSSNVTISGFDIDGGVRQTTRDPQVTESYAALIALHGCRNVVLRDLHLHHCQTDGLFITSSFLGGKPSIASRNVRLERVRCEENARGGMGVIQVLGLHCTNCSFSRNGSGKGRYGRHAPGFGVDIEPDYLSPADVDVLTGDCTFVGCSFDNNISAFLAGYRPRTQGPLRLIDCRSTNGQGGDHHIIVSWEGATIEGGLHDAGDGTVWLSWQGQTGGDVLVRNCEFRTSGQYGLFHPHAGNLVRLDGVRIIGTHHRASAHGEILAIQGDPGSGRRNLLRNCGIFVPAARKSPAHAYDYEVSLRHCLSEGNRFRTDLPAARGQHFCTDYGAGAVARDDIYRGTDPGPSDSFRPAHNSGFDTRRAFSTRSAGA